MKEYAKQFYKSKQWRETRDCFIKSKHYICERCGRMAEIVHHRTYITPVNINDPEITLNWDNLEALCQDCHNKEHLSNEKTCINGFMFDENGNLVPEKPARG